MPHFISFYSGFIGISGSTSYLSPPRRVWRDHPLHAVRTVTEDILEMSPLSGAMHADGGRMSVSPVKSLRAHLLQMLY
jgi:hypothetical protein